MSVISSLATAVGTGTLLEEVPSISAEMAEALYARGQRFCPLTEDQFSLVELSVRETLASVRVDTVDHVLVATETMTSTESRAGHEQLRGRLHRLLSELGLGHASLTAMTFGGCAAVMSALEYASLLVEAQRADSVLVVAVGALRDDDSRVLAPSISAIGDGVASCIVSVGGAGWRLDWMRRQAFLGISEFDAAEDFGPALVALGRALKTLRPSAAAGAQPQVLVCNNYGLPTLRLFASTLGVEEVFTSNVGRLSHLGTPDILVNLADLGAHVTEVLALATGPADCVLARMERT